ncbi:MAG: hypothetical protein AB7E05_00450 [Sphingobium sp.]
MNKPVFSEDISSAQPHPDAFIRWLDRGHNAFRLLAGLWLAYAAMRLAFSADAIAQFAFRDPDDALRLVQVRDFMAGQSWFDVSQHRINPPTGGPMHWSRLVDLPLAAIILLLRPVLGQAMAESIACAVVPLLTLGVIGFGLFAAVRRLTGNAVALLAVILLATSIAIVVQVSPMRIDHHGWQIAMAVGLLGGMLHHDPRKGGWIMGASIALWLHISSEGLPYAALAGGIAALRYAARPDEWPRLIRYAGMMAGGSALLLLATHGWRESLISHCDAMSPVYLGPILLLVPVLLLGRRIAGESSPLRRLLPVLIAGASAAALFAASAGPCLAGPFRTLDPLVYNLWYLGVLEGLPIWAQNTPIALLVVMPSLIGIAGLAAAAHAEQDSGRRLQWLSILGLLLGSFALSLLVLRAMAVAHLFALAGNAWIIARLYPAIAARKHMLSRALLTASLVALSPTALTLLAGQLAQWASPSSADSQKDTQPAYTGADIAALNALPATTLLAPLDVGPEILLRTSHDVIGTAHHRNVAGIRTVIRAFIAPPEEARRILLHTPSRYLLLVPRLNEIKRYRKHAPDGLAARLADGQVPPWLTPVPLTGAGELSLYRIDRGEAPGAPSPR